VAKNDRKRALLDLCAKAGLTYRTWSPGDGCTRFRFFRADVGEAQTYFGPQDGIHTVSGFGQALTFLYGAVTGARIARERTEAGK
jgi:hypothetical protein